MYEQSLQLAWHLQLFDRKGLRTTDGSHLHIEQPGRWNRDAGPDFLYSRIRLDGITLAGHIELHVRSSDWNRHKHSADPAYNPVILHVVYEHDAEIRTQSGYSLPTLCLQGKLPQSLLERSQALLDTRDELPCRPWLKDISSLHWHHWLDRMLIERLSLKTRDLEAMLRHTAHDWETVCFHWLARGFGLRANQDIFQLLAQTLPWTRIQRYRDDPQQLAALLFGQAGLLEGSFEDSYPRALQMEYRYLQKLHSLQALQAGLWRFSRMRPQSFPSLRLAQLAALLTARPQLLGAFLGIRTAEDFREFLHVPLPAFWDTHFSFQKAAKKTVKTISPDFCRLLLINVWVPFLFVYSRHSGQQEYQDRALDMLESLAPEENRILRLWRTAGIEAEHAGDGQALIHLWQEYCESRQCVRCEIGCRIIRAEEETIAAKEPT